MGETMFQFFAILSLWKLEIIRERTLAGFDSAKSEGRIL